MTRGYEKHTLDRRSAGACRSCGVSLPQGAVAWRRPGSRSMLCARCHADPAVRSGVAGAGAGDVAARTSDERRRRSFTTGQAGEQWLGRHLEQACADGPSVVLHDRHVPGHRWNIDHLVVAPAGIYVIDAKKYEGARVEVRSDPAFWSVRETRLLIRGRSGARELERMRRQLSAVG